MVVIEGLKDGPVKGKSWILTLYGDGDVIEYFDDKSLPLLVGKWKALEPHGRLIDADKLKHDNPNHMDADVPYVTEVTVEEIIDAAPTVLEASNKAETPRKARICPHYQGVCGLDEDILCYCSSAYEMCDTYKEALNDKE